MALCVVEVPNGLSGTRLQVSTADPCDGYLLVEVKQLDNQITQPEVFALFSAIAGLYAIAFVIKLVRRQIGF